MSPNNQDDNVSWDDLHDAIDICRRQSLETLHRDSNDSSNHHLQSQPDNGLAAAPLYNNKDYPNKEHEIHASSQPLENGDGEESTLSSNHCAIIKIRAWDPATPQSSHIITCTSDVCYENDDGGGAIVTKLSPVSEVDEENQNKNDSLHREVNGPLSEGNTKQPLSLSSATKATYETDKAKNEIDNDLLAGSYIGMHLPHNPSLSPSPTVWNINDTLCIQNNLNFIPHTGIDRLIHLMESNHPAVQTIIMDGLPTPTFTEGEAHKFATVLGETNTNVQSLSIRNSNINDEIASMFATALLDNTTLKHFSLEGNQLTSEAAKKFFDVMRSRGNNTLEKLDLRNNPLVHEEILEAIDQFMEQREFRTKLLKKKQKRAEDDSDGPNLERVTIVCHEAILDGTYYDPNSISLDDDDIPETPELNMSMTPHADESFTHYVQRIRPSAGRKSLRSAATTLLASQRLHTQSIRNLTGESANASSSIPSSTQSSVTSRSSAHSRNTQSRRNLIVETPNVESLVPSSRQSSFASRSSTHDSFLEQKRRNSLQADGQVGVHQVDEVAPGRQRRSLAGSQRRRAPMTQSQRLARLSALTDGGTSTNTFGRSSTRVEEHMQSMVTLESAGVESYNDNESRDQKRAASFSVFGLDDPELRVDCCACTCIICLTMVVLVMVVVYFMAM